MSRGLNSSALNSAIYVGSVRHRRFVPIKHEFTYPLFMLSLDLDELDQLIKMKWYLGTSIFHPVRYKRSDFYEPQGGDLKQAVVNRVQVDFHRYGLAEVEIKRVVLLTHLRYFNFTFNPVSFYYCYDAHDQLVAIQAEITNTPWKERHSYVLPVSECARGSTRGEIAYEAFAASKQTKHAFRFEKEFHVSPFNPMNMFYRWVFSSPNESLLVHMDNTMMSKGMSEGQKAEKHFDATLTMDKLDLNKNLGRTLIRYPFMTVKIVAGIYWQALKLYIKRSPFYSNPKHEA